VKSICLFLLVAAVARGGGVSFQQLSFAGEAENGIFAEDLDGDGFPDIVAMGRGRISIYRARPNSTPRYPTLPETVVTGSTAYFADVADVLPTRGKELLILTPRGVACFKHQGECYSPRPEPLLTCDTLLTAGPVRGAIEAAGAFRNVNVLAWNFAFDADGDGRDDILVPHGNGTDVYLQKEPGQFAKPVTLRLFPVVRHNGTWEDKAGALGARKARPVRIDLFVREIERRDVNGDRKPDLVCGTHWFAQKLEGGFDSTPALVPPGFRVAAPRGFMDVNADGRTDRILADNKNEDLLNIVTRVRIFLADEQGIIPATPTQVVVGQNILVHTHLPVHDFNNDGALDFAMFETDIRVTEVAKWIRQSFGKIDGRVNFYFFDREAGRYPRRRSYAKPIRMRFKVDLTDAMMGIVWERYLGTMMRFEGDFNADGRLDLLVREETDRIALYFNTGDRRDLYPASPNVDLRKVPAFAGLAVDDLNGDRASDLILFATGDPLAPLARPNNVTTVYISQLR